LRISGRQPGNPAPIAPLRTETFVNTDAGGAVAGKAEILAAIEQTKFFHARKLVDGERELAVAWAAKRIGSVAESSGRAQASKKMIQ